MALDRAPLLQRAMTELRHLRCPSPFGDFAVLWVDTAARSQVQRILIPKPRVPVAAQLEAHWPESRAGRSPSIRQLAARIRRLMEGADEHFDLAEVALERCSAFQQAVLCAEHGIPRGWVSTYGTIAAHLGVPGGARAVGRALATNPFPIVVPCHRAIRGDGSLGGYQGGLPMKRALLAHEGVEVSKSGRVLRPRVFYA